MTASHVALLAADHWQCAGAVTATLPEPPSLVKDALPGEMSIVQGARPSTRTVTTWPAMAKVPVRTESPGLGETLTLTVPVPVPLAPLTMDIQARSETAVHVHWLVVVTVTESDPPDALNDNDKVDSA